MKTTGNLGLKKPDGTDLVDIADLNGNMDILDNAVTNKVDKVTGKQLSTNDYSAAEKTKLAGIATGANNYTHPATHPPSIIAQDASNRFVTDAEKNTWNNKASTAEATLNTPGLMPQSAFEKLVDIEEGANRYIHPSTHPATMITEDTTHRFATDTEKAKWNNALPATGGVITGDVAIDPAGTVSNSWSRVLRFRFRDALNTMRERVLSVNPFGKLIFNANSQDYEIPVATTADITYYVRTDGNDSNNGLANTAAGAFKTWQKALDSLPKVINHSVNIYIADGTYNENVSIKGFSGGGTLTLTGNTSNAALVMVSSIDQYENFIAVTLSSITATATTRDSFTVNRCVGFRINDCRSISAASGFNGIITYFSIGIIANGTYSNKGNGINANAASHISVINTAGTGNTIGIAAGDGAILTKFGVTLTGTQPESGTGATITGGVLNPWGDNTTDTRSSIEASPSILQDNIPAVTWTKINFGSKGRDNLGEYNPATSTFTVSKTGIYAISVSVGFGFSSSISVPVRSLVDIYFNGGAARIRFVDTTMDNIIGLAANGAQVMRLNAGDTMNVYAYCSAVFGVSSDWQITNLRVTRIA